MSNLVFNLIAFIILIFLDNNIIKRSKNLKKEKSIKNIEKKWDDTTDFIFLISIITVMVIISNITSNLNRSGIIFILLSIIAYILTIYLAIKNKNYAIKKINDKLEQSKKKSLEELREFAINQMYDIVSKLHYVELDKIKEFISTYKNLFEMATTEAELISLTEELINVTKHQDARYKILPIRIIKRIVESAFAEAIYEEHSKVELEDFISAILDSNELKLKDKKEYALSIKNKLNSVEPQNNHSQNNKLYVLSSK